MTTLDRARAAAMERLGWEDDRANDDEYAGLLWEFATEIAQAVIDVVEADRALADAAAAIARGGQDGTRQDGVEA